MNAPTRLVLTVTDNVPFGQSSSRGLFALTLENPGWPSWQPGQFVMIRPTSWERDMLWARPFSICRVTAQSLVLFFQVAGRGTSRLTQLQAGDTVTVWGPLGTGFAMAPKKDTLLLAGGVGIAPFVGYVDAHPDLSRVSMLFGHRQPANSYPADTLSRRIDVEVFREAKPEDLPKFQARIRAHMEECHKRGGMALACGPLPFLRTVGQYARHIGLPTQVSLERRMACGVGACLGCVAPTSFRWPDAATAGLPVQTCTKGPVFWTEHLDWDAL